MFKWELVAELKKQGFDTERATYVANWLRTNSIKYENYLEQMNYLYGGLSNGLLPKNDKENWGRILWWDYRR